MRAGQKKEAFVQDSHLAWGSVQWIYGSKGQTGRRSGMGTVFGMLPVIGTIESNVLNRRVRKDLKPDPKK